MKARVFRDALNYISSMKTRILVIILLIGYLANAQPDKEGIEVMKPITRLFRGMNLGDSAMVHGAFSEEESMGTITKDKSDNPILKKLELSNFLNAVGTPHVESWSEPIWDAKIDIDGDFAQVWTKYAFYVGKKFSHCGVDAFHLIKDGKEWSFI